MLLLVVHSSVCHCSMLCPTFSHRRRNVLVSAAAAMALATPTYAQAEAFDLDACLAKFGSDGRQLCFAKMKTVEAAAKNEVRKARLAQCNAELELVQQNDGALPPSVKPATDDPTMPATCVGAPTYQLKGPGDPSLPQIY